MHRGDLSARADLAVIDLAVIVLAATIVSREHRSRGAPRRMPAKALGKSRA
jgi:hypothetical protein